MSPVLTSPLVSTQWLADHLGSDALVVLDASVHTSGAGAATTWRSADDDYAGVGHVPGAVFADLVDALSAADEPLPFTRPDVGRFEQAVGALGVSNSSTVVVYDAAFGQWAARLWWLFRSFGFDDVAVLDGGFRKWQAEERPMRGGRLRPRPATFLAAEERPLWADRARVLRAVDGAEPAVLVRALADVDLGPEHPDDIPGSVVIPVQELLDAATNALLRPPNLRSVFGRVLAADEIVTYCGVGNAACLDALALTMLGHERVRVYDGSLSEWWGAAVRR